MHTVQAADAAAAAAANSVPNSVYLFDAAAAAAAASSEKMVAEVPLPKWAAATAGIEHRTVTYTFHEM